MTDVELVSNKIHNILCHYKENQNRIIIEALNNVRTCDGGHLALTQATREKMFCCRQMSIFYKIILLLTLIFIFATYGIMYLLRRYNHVNIFGGCSMSLLWPFDECPVVY